MADSKRFTAIKRAMTLLIIFSLVLVTVLIPQGTIQAQSNPQASISPSSATISVGETTTVSVNISSGADINAFDITVTYDPAFITLDSYSTGSYLNNLAKIREINNSGSLNLVFTQLATAGANGDGTLLNLVFRGTAEGKSAVTITSLSLAQSSGALFQPSIQNGEINVGAAQPVFTMTSTTTVTPPAIHTSTATATSTSTATPTNTTTATHTITPTRTSTPIRTATPTRTSVVVSKASSTPTRTPSSAFIRTATRAAANTQTTAKSGTPTESSLALTTLTVQAQTLAAPIETTSQAAGTVSGGTQTAGEITPTPAIELPIPQTGQYSQLLCFVFILLLIILIILMVIILKRRSKKKN